MYATKKRCTYNVISVGKKVPEVLLIGQPISRQTKNNNYPTSWTCPKNGSLARWCRIDTRPGFLS